MLVVNNVEGDENNGLAENKKAEEEKNKEEKKMTRLKRRLTERVHSCWLPGGNKT